MIHVFIKVHPKLFDFSNSDSFACRIPVMAESESNSASVADSSSKIGLGSDRTF